MADQIEDLTKRMTAVEERVDLLSASMDRRFDAVDEALLEQRRYTEFAFSRLEAKMDNGFTRMDARFEKMETRFEKMDSRFDRLERKLDQFIDGQPGRT